MVKAQIIQTIVEASESNDQLAKSILGHSIVESSRQVFNSEVNPYEVKPILEAGLFLCEQIEKCDAELKNNPDDRDIIRQRNKYLESLRKCIDQL